MWFSTPPSPSTWKGALSGLVGGLVASFMMNQFQAALSAIKGAAGGDEANRHPGDDPSDEQGDGQEASSEPATVKAASAISEGAFDYTLTEREKEFAGPAVHYSLGGSTGAVYGAAAEFLPDVTLGVGLPFGTVFWLVADEAAVPALGLSKAPTEYPPSVHVESLAAHLVYGLTTELVRRGVRHLLR